MGEQLADFVEFLNRSGVPATSLQIIGFSLGAEAAGFAGKALKRRGRAVQIGRITGKKYSSLHILRLVSTPTHVCNSSIEQVENIFSL